MALIPGNGGQYYDTDTGRWVGAQEAQTISQGSAYNPFGQANAPSPFGGAPAAQPAQGMNQPAGFEEITKQYPGFVNNVDQTEFAKRAGQINYDQSGVNALRDYATAAPGSSPWESMMLKRQGLEQNQALSNAGSSSNAATQNAYSQVAQRGGLGSGAAQRIAMSGQRDLNAQRQAIYGQGAQQRMGIGIQGEQNRLGALAQLPGAQSQAAQTQLGMLSPWQQMLQNQAGIDQNKNAYNQGQFNTWAGLYGANKTADAIRAGG